MKELPLSTSTYQIHFLYSKAHKPFNFAVHVWVVIVSPQGTHRYEILHKKNKDGRNGYLHIDTYPLVRGLRKSLSKLEYWESRLLKSIEGEENGLAQRMVDFVRDYSKDYLYKDRYHIYPGPNSNAYPAWILRKFPEADIKLPWNAFGKNYL